GEHASAQAIADAGDGNIFVAGWTGDKSGGYGFPFPTFPWIMKIDGQGDTIWEISDASQTDKIYSLSFINDLAKTSGGGVILIGMQNFAPLIIKQNKDGKVEWKNRVVHLYGEGFSIVESKKDGFLAVGALNHDFTFAIGTRGDAWLAKFDKSGNITWEKFYGGCDADMLFSLIEVEDGRIIAGGTRDVSAERVMSLLICLICTMELSLLIKRRETF
ncbi:MAG: hypothetical protein FJ088_07320, partial [Deltaproteobacteria bacterium]|nr:hypothetical protein [Deltaproteobacteria bacterium]